MMQSYYGHHGQLQGSEIHGFHTLQDLDMGNIIEEASSRWLRPNEIHAILCNYKYFTINVKPMNLPQSGRIILFDRKVLRNFRKDGHNWKKKKDGKTVKEAHEHLKVGNEERIHVYYAHGQDNPTFVRRCYWLLDKAYEHIVLVHYRETQESQGSPSPATPVNSSLSSVSDTPAPRILSEEYDSGANHSHYVANQANPDDTVPGDSLTDKNLEMRLHELNTLDWDELVTDNNSTNFSPSGGVSGGISFPEQQVIAETVAVGNNGRFSSEASSFSNLNDSIGNMGTQMGGMGGSGSSMHNQVDLLDSGGLQSQDSFGRWINCIITDPPGSVSDALLESSLTYSQYSSGSPPMDSHQSLGPELIFSITDVSPGCAFSKEKTKILVTGFFHEGYAHLAKSNILCIIGDVCVPAEIVQVGVYRCYVSPHSPGLVNFFLSFDGHKPISQVINFEFRDLPLHKPLPSDENQSEQEDPYVLMRLAHLLSTTSKSLDIASSKVSPSAVKEGKKFAFKTANLMKSWEYLMKAVKADKASFPRAKENMFELMLKSRLKEWLLERVIGGCKSSELDAEGQGVIHLCAILGYTWSVQLFSWSSLSLDFRDRSGWTALHWAAYYGREKMVASLLSAGAKPNLVTDPTSQNPGGCTAADLASKGGHEGLAAYLAEKGLIQHFKDMSIAGNISGSLPNTQDTETSENLTVDEVYLKDTLAAYRTAADAAARIQSAFRENSMNLRVQQVEFANPEDEARSIIAAMRIQHAFRNYDTKKQMVAAARIQHRFRSWKLRREFLNMRRQAIKIQAVFRGFQVRRQYRKIIWSVGVLEKAILRWRLKRKGFRGLQVEPLENVSMEQKEESDTEEDFFRISRRQAEERVERSVVRVQAMFRSKKAQEEYRRMKLAHNEAEIEYEEQRELDSEMER